MTCVICGKTASKEITTAEGTVYAFCGQHYQAMLKKLGEPLITRKARSTGTKVSLYFDQSEDGDWSTVCEDHGGIVYHATKTAALSFLSHPEDWCPGCQG